MADRPSLADSNSGGFLETAKTLFSDVAGSAFHQGIQSPYNGVAQLWNRTGGALTHTQMSMMDVAQPETVQFGSARWYAQTIGGAAGMVLPFLACKGAVSGLGRGFRYSTGLAIGETATAELLNSTAGRLAMPVLEAGASGAMFEGVFRPVNDNENFALARFRNAAIGFGTFSALSVGSTGLKALDRQFLSAERPWMVNTFKHDVARNALAGFGAGALDANMHSVAEGHGLASLDDTMKSAYSFGLLGGLARGAGEVGARARGQYMAGDIVARDAGMQKVIGASEQGRMLMADYGDARMRAADISPAADPMARSMQVVSELARVEARHNVAPGADWQTIADREIASERSKAKTAGSEAERQHHSEHADEIAQRIEAAKRQGLPDKDWEQTRFAMIREYGFLNGLRRSFGDAHELRPSVEQSIGEWRQRWSDKVDSGQELRAKLSSAFNANHADPKGAEEYNRTMNETGPAKARVVTNALPLGADGQPIEHPIIVDVGSADGFIPDAVMRARPDATVFGIDLDPNSFLTMLEKKRAFERDPSNPDGFRAIPLFADGVDPKLPFKSVDAFSTLSNLHELVSYPRNYYGQYNPENARLALNGWARSLTDGGRIIVKDFLKPAGNKMYRLEFRDLGQNEGPLVIEGEPYAAEYSSGRGAARFFEEFIGKRPWRASAAGEEPRHETVKFGGKNLNFKEIRNVQGELIGIECDAATAQELMISANYGMRELRSEMLVNVAEQYGNFSTSGYNDLMHRASPTGARLQPTDTPHTRTGPDYLSHRNMFFDLKELDEQTGQWHPVDLSANNRAFDVTYMGSFDKVPGSAAGRLTSHLAGPLERGHNGSIAARYGFLCTPPSHGGFQWIPANMWPRGDRPQDQ
jgi:SAM-dependent methyltransferase